MGRFTEQLHVVRNRLRKVPILVDPHQVDESYKGRLIQTQGYLRYDTSGPLNTLPRPVSLGHFPVFVPNEYVKDYYSLFSDNSFMGTALPVMLMRYPEQVDEVAPTFSYDDKLKLRGKVEEDPNTGEVVLFVHRRKEIQKVQREL